MKIQAARAKQDTNLLRMPLLVSVVIIFSIASCFGGRIIDINVTALGWSIPLVLSLLLLLYSPKGIVFPIHIWLPWVSVIVFYQLFAEAENSFQRSIMLLTPLSIGVAVSRTHLDEHGLHLFLKLCRFSAGALILIVLYKTDLLFSGTLPFVTGLAPEVMTGSVLCVIFAASYVLGNKRDLVWWAGMAVLPVIAVTRMGMVGAAISLPFTLAPMKMAKRLAFLSLLIAFGITIFFTERVQQKMFYSGEGTMQEARWANPDFATSGRSAIWDIMWKEIAESPWFGHGANASEEVISRIAPGITHPHNDWLRLIHDYGYIGTAVFFLTIISQLIHAFKAARGSTGHNSVLFYAGASSMLIFGLFMFTDNIILYASFFGNLQFTILGLAYGSYQPTVENLQPQEQKVELSIKW